MATGIRTAVLVGWLLGAAAGPAWAEQPARVAYEGQLEDAKKQPLSGIFPLTFNLYRSEKSTRPAWSEAHFVAVQNGRYAVELGDHKPIPANLPLDRLYLGVALSGGAEILRERLAAPEAVAPPAAAPSAVAPAQPAAAPAEPGRPGGESYAEIAGFAYEADRAKSADSIGGLSAKDIRTLVKEGKPEIVLGTKTRTSNVAGGTGGQPYDLRCPKGYVVTGISGGAAAFVDSVSIICSPLE